MLNKLSNDVVEERNGLWLLFAWMIAVAATLTALFIGEIVGQTPCNLCWFQRIFMFPLAIILGIAAFRSDSSIKFYALPLVGLGAAIALLHTLIYFGLLEEAIVPCTRAGPSCAGEAMTILGSVPLPLASLIAFAAIGGLLFLCRPGVYR
ncbi:MULTISPECIES: disulfide bond formation protein B [unclassified Nitratireductor]|uniref:disulfide bond formation protein B n=1 Tax=unclassified Nitratireductor TaxID=2641084 RepID=UPI000D0E2FD4|nr:disulfide bond formation protein B [Nitratireductor sp. StC3]PSM16002.1 disulfide bond formation protein B [Nitratireductor sp. StC3]